MCPECERGLDFKLKMRNCRRFQAIQAPECERGVDFKLKIRNCRRFQALQAPECERGVDFKGEDLQGLRGLGP